MSRTASPLRALTTTVLLVVALGGCTSYRAVTMRSTPESPLVERLQLSSWSGPKPTPRTMQVLRVYNLTEDLEGEPGTLLAKLEGILEREPTPEKVHAIAELAYLAGRKTEDRDAERAQAYYGTAVLHSFQYLFDPRFVALRNPYDPQFRGACDIYNGALESALRMQLREEPLRPGMTYTIRTASGPCDITCVLQSGRWRPEDFERFEFVSDYNITGLRNQHHGYGLGVPLIAVRRRQAVEAEWAKHYPPELSFPVTALLRPCGALYPPGAGEPPRAQAMLELHDPLVTNRVGVGAQAVPLESDLTVPLAYFLSRPQYQDLATVGLLHPERLLEPRASEGRPFMGVYMIQPYEPGKIPVLFVHGFWSSPMTWMEMFNDLRSIPEIRQRYQFWFHFYPTGQPFWISAAQLRQQLDELRRTLDPRAEEPALDQMVLVGHSMGGLISRLQTIDSGDRFWSLVSDHRLEELEAEPEVRAKLQSVFFFRPNPSIRRVVTIGTPLRGSSYSNGATQWLGEKLIGLPQKILESQQALYRHNRELIRDGRLLQIRTSIESLSPESPIFPAMLASRRVPWTQYHNIVGLVPKKGLMGHLASGSDGVVTYESAHADDAKSEIVIPADHMTMHAHPLAVLEVRRILLEHLAALRGLPAPLTARR